MIFNKTDNQEESNTLKISNYKKKMSKDDEMVSKMMSVNMKSDLHMMDSEVAMDINNNIAYQRYKQQNKKKGMDDDEAEKKSKAIIQKLEGVLKSKVQGNLQAAQVIQPLSNQSSLKSDKQRRNTSFAVLGANPFGLLDRGRTANLDV